MTSGTLPVQYGPHRLIIANYEKRLYGCLLLKAITISILTSRMAFHCEDIKAWYRIQTFQMVNYKYMECLHTTCGDTLILILTTHLDKYSGHTSEWKKHWCHWSIQRRIWRKAANRLWPLYYTFYPYMQCAAVTTHSEVRIAAPHLTCKPLPSSIHTAACQGYSPSCAGWPPIILVSGSNGIVCRPHWGSPK